MKSPNPVRIVKDENRNNISLELKDKLKTINNFASKIRPQRPASPFIRSNYKKIIGNISISQNNFLIEFYFFCWFG